jgi:uncharacterized protein YkwD
VIRVRVLGLGLICFLGVGLLILAQSGTAGARSGLSRARASQQCPDANVPVMGASASVLRSGVVCLINQERELRGLPALRTSARLNAVAQRHTQTMVASGVFSHGADFTLRFTDGGYDWRAAGENIATGYATPRTVVAAWMASLGHCRNILSPVFRDVGTGVSPGSVGADIGPGTWTEDFGLSMKQSSPSGNTGPESGCPY